MVNSIQKQQLCLQNSMNPSNAKHHNIHLNRSHISNSGHTLHTINIYTFYVGGINLVWLSEANKSHPQLVDALYIN